MSKKKYFIITSIVFIMCISAFGASYLYGLSKYKNSGNDLRKSKVNVAAGSNKTISIFNSNDIIEESTKITLKTFYKKSGETINASLDSKQLIGKGKKDLEELGYTVEKMSKAEVTLHKEEDLYSPNKYVIDLTKDNYLAIFRTSENGEEYLENEAEDVSDRALDKEYDINIYKRGDKGLQFESKDEAREALENRLEDFE